MKEESLSLAQILGEGPVLVDTCALIGALDTNSDNGGDWFKSAKLYLSHLNNGGGVYIRPSVILEYPQSSTDYLKKFNVIATFCGDNKVVRFSGEEQVEYLSNYIKYNYLKGLGDVNLVDYDQLISAITLQKLSRKTISILSRDFPLLKCWSEAGKCGAFNPKELRFFIRKEFDGFHEGEVQ